MKFLALALLVLMIVGCTNSRKSMYIQMVNEITADYMQKVSQQGDFVPNVIGGGMIGEVQRISAGFETHQQLDVSQVRLLLVEKEELFLSLLNSHKGIRPFLHTYPFEAKDFELTMSFITSTGKRVDPPQIALAFVLLGKIYYSIYNSEANRLETVFSESYDEAYKIVYGDASSSSH